jgi:hypothetical protein
MDVAKPADFITAMVDASVKKLALEPRDLLVRGAIAGALLGAATGLKLRLVVTFVRTALLDKRAEAGWLRLYRVGRGLGFTSPRSRIHPASTT